MKLEMLKSRIREYIADKLPSTWDSYVEVDDDDSPNFTLVPVDYSEVEIRVWLLRLSFGNADIVKFYGRTANPDLLAEAATIMRDLNEIVNSVLKSDGA